MLFSTHFGALLAVGCVKQARQILAYAPAYRSIPSKSRISASGQKFMFVGSRRNGRMGVCEMAVVWWGSLCPVCPGNDRGYSSDWVLSV